MEMSDAAEATGRARAPYRIEHRWKEQVIYWEGDRGYLFDAGWGVEPPVLYVPSPAIWTEVMPDWLRERRVEVVRRLELGSSHVLAEDIHGYYRNDPEARQLQAPKSRKAEKDREPSPQVRRHLDLRQEREDHP
jgi:hypothetical protein